MSQLFPVNVQSVSALGPRVGQSYQLKLHSDATTATGASAGHLVHRSLLFLNAFYHYFLTRSSLWDTYYWQCRDDFGQKKNDWRWYAAVAGLSFQQAKISSCNFITFIFSVFPFILMNLWEMMLPFMVGIFEFPLTMGLFKEKKTCFSYIKILNK